VAVIAAGDLDEVTAALDARVFLLLRARGQRNAQRGE
jgi:hypothetical protein